MATTTQPVSPSPPGMLKDGSQCLEVATYTMIAVIATQFRTQHPILLGQWRMAVLPAPCPYSFHKPAEALPTGLPLDDPVSTACFGPIVGTSEKVECPRAPGRVLTTQGLIARNQRRLFGMNGQTETVEPLWQDGHHPARVGFQLAADDEIIGKTSEKTPPLQAGLPLCDNPFIQDVMQEYVGQEWRRYTSYNVANILVEFSTSIPRTQLQPGYGDGFLGAPLQMGRPPERPTSQQRGGRRGTSSTHANPRDSPHV